MYFLKQYFPIFRTANLLCIGIPGTKHYLEYAYLDCLYLHIDRLTSSGISKGTLVKHRIYRDLFKKNMLIKFDEYTKFLNDRHKLFFQYLNIDPISEERFYSKILIFGAGAAGATIAILLSQFGFQNIIVADDDIVEQSDINKTLIFRKEHLGKSKVECIKKIVSTNYHSDIIASQKRPSKKEDIYAIVNQYQPDLVIKACDPNLSFRIYLNDICFKKEIPFIHMSYSFDRINIGPFFIPGITSCDNYFNEIIKANKGKDYDFLHHKKLFNNYTTHPSTSFNINILSNYILIDILFFFLGKIESIKSLGRAIHSYPLQMKSFSHQVQCGKSCYCRTIVK